MDIGVRPTAGQKIGKYRILEQIGRGGMGTIFKAHDPLLDRLVALKVISPDVEVTDELRARFFREAQACAKLNHPNIVTVYDLGEDEGRLFIVMELLEGHELRRLIVPGAPLTLEDKLSVMIQVCGGLSYAHQKGIVHRDMKPGNVFVLPSGRVKILDFGIAHMATTDSGLTRTGLIMGTLRYISPEQVRGRADHRSDMFSVGSVFYELLTLRPAFTAEEPMGLLEQLRGQDPPPPSEIDARIPEPLSAIVQRAMRKEPRERFRDLDEMRLELEQVQRALTAERYRVSARVRDQRERLGRLEANLSERFGIAERAELPPLDESQGLAAMQAMERALAARIVELEGKIAEAEERRVAAQAAVRAAAERREAAKRLTADTVQARDTTVVAGPRGEAPVTRVGWSGAGLRRFRLPVAIGLTVTGALALYVVNLDRRPGQTPSPVLERSEVKVADPGKSAPTTAEWRSSPGETRLPERPITGSSQPAAPPRADAPRKTEEATTAPPPPGAARKTVAPKTELSVARVDPSPAREREMPPRPESPWPGAPSRADVDRLAVKVNAARRRAEQSAAAFWVPQAMAAARTKEELATAALERADLGAAGRLLTEAEVEYLAAADGARKAADDEHKVADVKSRVTEARGAALAQRSEAMAAQAGRLAREELEAAEAAHREADDLDRRSDFVAAARAYEAAAAKYREASRRAQAR